MNMEKKRFKKIYIEITNICNLKCSFCPDTKRKKTFMKVKDFEKIIKQIKKYTNLIALHVKGEPLMHPELEEILGICDSENINVNITTNGTLLYEKRNILINSSALRQINISLHSINENANMNSTYLNNVFEAVKKITNERNIYISYRLWNLKDISENDCNLHILKKLEDEYNYTELPNKAKYSEFIKLKENVFLNQDTKFEWPSIGNKEISTEGTCLGLRNQIAILVNGDVVPCCLDQNGEIKLGNIFEINIDDILNSDLSIKIKKGFEEGKVLHNLCKKCGYRTKFFN